MVGKSGRVIAADIHKGMLQKAKGKIKGTALEKRILPHPRENEIIGVTDIIDFVLLFYMVHEAPIRKTSVMRLEPY